MTDEEAIEAHHAWSEHQQETDMQRLEARLTEATALLERCRDFPDLDDEDAAYQLQRDAIVWLSRAPAQPAAPTPNPDGCDFSPEEWRAIEPAAPETSAETLAGSERACLKRLGTTLRMHKADAVHPLEWHERICVEKALRTLESAEAQLAAVRLPPHEQTSDVRAQLLPRLDVLSSKLCQTQGYILTALNRAGLTVALLTAPSPGAGETT